ncbi:17141_t:CDS:2 [Racocetra fulgida]|uniref:17141_t:CDS:1 n=1 Tax=Racocetra fulgida TaxID=60492 RepID=A0A9N9FPF3_9GLOM|nr:17141_t:CDS:2 [Racocetra fulgida]
MSGKQESILFSDQKDGTNCQSEGKIVIRKTKYSPKKRGPKRKLPLGNTDLESNDPMHHKVRIQRNITMEILIQAFDDPTKDLMIKLQDLFNMLVGAGLYNLESPTSSKNEEGSRNIEMSIKDIVDTFTNKIKEIFTKLLAA